jgi:hypothetical protein
MILSKTKEKLNKKGVKEIREKKSSEETNKERRGK